MRFAVEANGRRHLVEARRSTSGWLVSFDGRQLATNLARVGERWSLLIGPGSEGPPEGGPHAGPYVGSGVSRTSKSYDIAIESRGRRERIVHVDGQAVHVLLAPSPVGRHHEGHVGVVGGMTRLESPMAGRVTKVLVRVGEAVAGGQGLVVVEAMKMENELRAPRAGTVTDVRVADGASIDAGTILVVIE